MILRRRAAVGVAALVMAAACSLEPVDLDDEVPLSLRSTIRAADGRVLTQLYKENRVEVSLDEMSPYLIDAVLAAEDDRFFEHPGYDLQSIARAAIVNAREKRIVQGGSTITQQYVKNSYFRRPPRTFERKARELRLAIELERRLSKREILERYLNTIYLGGGAYGVGTASQIHFRKHVRGLKLHEAALLAALIKAPTDYDPREHPKRALSRRNTILQRMLALGKIGPAEARGAMAAPLGVSPDPPRLALREPYFVEAVKREILADRRLGANANQRTRALWEGGLDVRTTVVPRLQRAAHDAARRVLGQRGDPEVALVSIKPSTGEVVAMVSGRSWRASQVNLALGRAGGGSGRQPGSSFKPIVAAAALESGIDLSTRYEASPVIFDFDGKADPWVVRNSEGTATGFLPLDEALVRSVNGVYARLAMQLGPAAIVSQARLMGIKTKLPLYPSIALGSAEVSVLDMATAYATIANHGTSVEPTTIKEIRLHNGDVLRPEQKKSQGAMSPGSAYLLTKTMEQVIERGTGRAADIGRPAAGKTGTTNDYADAWFVGYTPQLVTAVWVGYPQGRIPMTSVHGIRVVGGTFPALIWREYMREALRGEPVETFKLPRSELITVLIDPESGLLAAPWCPGEPQSMLRQLAPTEYCPLPPPPPAPSPTPTASPSPTPTPTPTPSPTKAKKKAEPSPSPT